MPPTTDKTPPRKTLNDFPAYRESAKRLRGYQAELLTLDKKITQLELAAQTVSRSGKIEEEAEALRRGNDGASRLTSAAVIELRAAEHRRAVLQAAIRQEKAECDNQADVAGREICEGLLPTHRALVRKIAEALIPLCAACQAERAFRDGFLTEGIGNWFRAMDVIGGQSFDVKDANGAAAQWLAEAVDNGLIDRNDAILKGVTLQPR